MEEGERTMEKADGRPPPGGLDKRTAPIIAEDFFRPGRRRGITTGTCAAAAAWGAACLLLTGTAPSSASLVLPAGVRVRIPLEEMILQGGGAECTVRKDAGDDPDVTDGIRIRVRVEYTDAAGTDSGTAEKASGAPEIRIEGGAGVGRITKPGLDQGVGSAAINRVPRQMIRAAVEAARREAAGDTESGREADTRRGLLVTVSVPDGEEIAKRTFNEKLGITGGISILGTSGLVEPMSTKALLDVLSLEIRQQAVMGVRDLILVPGNYGAAFVREQGWDQLGVPLVRCSNYIGDALDAAGESGFRSVLVVGHLGKLVKLAGGIFHTHSRAADCRMELICAHAAVCGADSAVCGSLMDAAATDAAIGILDRAALRKPVLQSLSRAIQRHLTDRAEWDHSGWNRAGQNHTRLRRTEPVRAGAVLFSNIYGGLIRTECAERILADWTARAVHPAKTGREGGTET